jgi:hypothetical protein
MPTREAERSGRAVAGCYLWSSVHFPQVQWKSIVSKIARGPPFADILKLLFPSLWPRIIFLTGIPSVLSKPCTIVAIRSAIAQVLHNAAEQISQHA